MGGNCREGIWASVLKAGLCLEGIAAFVPGKPILKDLQYLVFK